MLRLQYKSVKKLVGEVLSLCDTDDRILSYVNRACERLLYEMHSVGSYIRYQVCVTNGCITWPRMIETIEKAAVCSTPIHVRNNWYEFLGAGPGILSGSSIQPLNLVDQGEFPAFDEVVGTDKKLAVYCDRKEDAGKYITLQFYSGGAQWVRTTFNSEQIDGEKIALTPAFGAYVLTANTCMANGLVRVFKDETVGNVRLYEYDTVNLVYKPLAYYEPSETIPVYRRSLLPGCGAGQNGAPMSVTVMAKIRFIPVSQDDDFLVIGHAEAIRLAAQAILKEENSKLAEAGEYWYGRRDGQGNVIMAGAIPLLHAQIRHWQGAGAIVPIQIQSQNSAAVYNMI